MDLKNIYKEIWVLVEAFKSDANKRLAGNKAAGMRSRKLSFEIEKLLKAWRKESIK